jgi:hypothetical protein
MIGAAAVGYIKRRQANTTINYIKRRQANLTPGSCPASAREISQTLLRESDQTTWCLSNLPEPPIYWQWSPDGNRFAYALQDKKRPTRRLSGRMGYLEVNNFNWYVMNGDGSGHKRFSSPDPFWFTFSPDGQYAVYSTYNDYGRNKYEVVKIDNESLVCRYDQHNLWYYAGRPPCNAVKLKNGSIWDIEREANQGACEYHVTSWGWTKMLDERGCRTLLKNTDLAPTVTPAPTLPSITPVPPQPSTPSAYPGLPDAERSSSYPYP